MSDDQQLFRVQMMRNTVVKNYETGLTAPVMPLRKNPKTGLTELKEIFVMVSRADAIYLCRKKKSIPASPETEKLMNSRGNFL